MVCLFFGLWAFGTGGAHAASDLDLFRRTGVNVAISSWKPYSFKAYDGKQTGILIDIWELWSRKTGIPVHFKPSSWATTLELMKSGACDIHSGLYYTKERDLFLDYVAPLFTSEGILFTRKDTPIPCDELYGKAVFGVISSGYEEYYLHSHFPDARRVAKKSTTDLVAALLKGEIQAGIAEHSTVLLEARERQAFDQIKICKHLYERELYAAVRQGNTQLAAVVRQGLARITPEELEKIERRWFVADEKPDRKMIKIFWAVVIFSLLLLAGRKWLGRRFGNGTGE